MAQVRTFTPDELAEIRRSYRNCYDPKAQVEILADLHACSKQDIQQALGLQVTNLRRPAGKALKPQPDVVMRLRQPWTEEQDDRLLALYAQGLTNGEIGDQMGRTAKAINDRLCVLRKQGVIQHRPRYAGVTQGAAVELDNLCDALRELILVLRMLAEKGGGA